MSPVVKSKILPPGGNRPLLNTAQIQGPGANVLPSSPFHGYRILSSRLNTTVAIGRSKTEGKSWRNTKCVSRLTGRCRRGSGIRSGNTRGPNRRNENVISRVVRSKLWIWSRTIRAPQKRGSRIRVLGGTARVHRLRRRIDYGRGAARIERNTIYTLYTNSYAINACNRLLLCTWTVEN